MHEHDRLIRVWITPQGTHIKLELLKVPVFSVPVYLKEHKWYHICQSWSSQYGAWSLYMDGKLKARGNKPQVWSISSVYCKILLKCHCSNVMSTVSVLTFFLIALYVF